MVPAGNKDKRLSLVNHTTKTIPHLIEDKLYQIIDQFNERKVTPVKFHSIRLNKIHPFHYGNDTMCK